MKTNYSENYSPHKLLLRVAIIVFETVQCYSNMSSGSHVQQLLTVSLEICTCRTHTLRIIILYYIIQVYCMEDHYTCTLHVVAQVCMYKALCICLSANKTSNFLWYCQPQPHSVYIILNHSAATCSPG